MTEVLILVLTSFLATALISGLSVLSSVLNRRRALDARDPATRKRFREQSLELETPTPQGSVPGKFLLWTYSMLPGACGVLIAFKKQEPRWILLSATQLVFATGAHIVLSHFQRVNARLLPEEPAS